MTPVMAITLDFNYARKTLSRFIPFFLTSVRFSNLFGSWSLYFSATKWRFSVHKIVVRNKTSHCFFKPDWQHKIDWKIFKLEDIHQSFIYSWLQRALPGNI